MWYYSGTLNLKTDDEKDSFKRQLILGDAPGGY